MQDIEYLKSMYPSGIRILQGYVAEACDRLDYKNSPMYDEYPDHMMINRLCDTICDTVIASEGAEKVRGMWNISEHDKAVMEMAELKKDMKRLDVDFFTEDDEPVMEQEQDLENAAAENISDAEDLTTEDSLEEQAVSNIQNNFQGYRESVVNPSGIIMETQEMRGREPGFPGNGRMGGRPNMGPGPGRPPMGNNPGRPPMGPGPVRPPSGPNQDRPPVGGPGPVRPPQPPRPTPPPPRPPQPPRPTPPPPPRPPQPPRPTPPPPRPPQPPRPTPPPPPRPPQPPRPTPPPPRPPQPPRPTPPPPRPPQPPRPTPPPPPRPPQPPRPTPPPPPRPPRPQPPRPPMPPRPVPPPKPGNRPSWLRDMVKVLLLNEMFHRRCARGLCAL